MYVRVACWGSSIGENQDCAVHGHSATVQAQYRRQYRIRGDMSRHMHSGNAAAYIYLVSNAH
jgi:hypothetical protein